MRTVYRRIKQGASPLRAHYTNPGGSTAHRDRVLSSGMNPISLRLEGAALSDTGNVRKNNEDSYYYDPGLQLFAVADGMGGHKGGEVASRIAVEALARAAQRGIPDEEYQRHRSLAGRRQIFNWLTATIEGISLEMQAYVNQDPSVRGMGCTLDVILIRQNGVFIAHIGDSRCYVLRQGELNQLTEDHTLGAMLLQTGAITEEQAANHPHRHVLTRALGPFPRVELDTSYLEIRAGDVFLLCSDGLYDEVSAEQIHSLLGQPPEPAAQQLIQAALGHGGRDNVTAMVVAVTEYEAMSATIIGSDEALTAMARAPLFHNLTWHELFRMQKIAVARVYAAGDSLMEQGEPCHFIRLNVHGTISVFIDGVHMLDSGPGESFGQNILEPMTASLTVRAHTEVTVLEFPVEQIKRLVADEPVLGVKLLQAAFARTMQHVNGLVSSMTRYRRLYGPLPDTDISGNDT